MDENAIVVQGLRKVYGDVKALDGIDFEAKAGTVFGLLGPNGAGKTTAIRVLATVLRPDGGHAEVLGLDVVEAGGRGAPSDRPGRASTPPSTRT